MSNRIFLTSILIFLFLFVSSVSAQIGIKGGVGISDIVFSEEGQTPYLGYEINSLNHRLPMLSFQVGAFGTLELGKRIDFQPELLFITQGLNYSTTYLYDEIPYKINISYLNMPLLLRYKISINKKRQSGLFAGPYVSWKLNAVKITEVGGQTEKIEMSNVKDVDFGIVAGYSIDFNLPSGQIIVDFRCSYSLINIMETIEGYVPYYYGPSKEYARNVSISLAVGYRFLKVWSKNAEEQ